MRKFDKSSEYDVAESEAIKAEQWQLDLLALNPDYVYWGPHEDYMWKEKGGWDSRQIFASWDEFGPWNLDELNECVNFYFSVNRENKECEVCKGDGYHKNARYVVDGFYQHSSHDGLFWHDKITQDEVQALVDAGRLRDFTHGKPEGYVPTAAEVNQAERHPRRGFIGHDGINRSIIIRTRLNRLGIPVECDNCDGNGYVYTSDKPHVSLTLWMLHPRKGCSRGVEVNNIKQEDLPKVYAWLNKARERNNERFSKLPTIVGS